MAIGVNQPLPVSKQATAWWVYLVQCADDSLYAGITTDLDRRVAQHNGDIAGGAKYTAPRRPVKLVYSEPCTDRSAAAKREYLIRKLPTQRKRALLAAKKLP